MPICVDRQRSGKAPRSEWRKGHTNVLHVGLISNMPDSALQATERQFRTLLEEAAEGAMVHLSLYTLPEVPRSKQSVCYIGSNYSNINDLWDSRIDGLIVTGSEPSTPNLRDEPYWSSLTTLIEWADANTFSSVWSCLAAHAAVLHIDGIERRPLGDKLFGVFECAKVSSNPLTAKLTAGVPDRLKVPHSRWNDILSDIADDGLAKRGYHVLARSDDVGLDMFVKQKKSLFLFFQGHPEYEADSLLLEYRRDVRRFLRRERVSYPLMPQDYFDDQAAILLSRFENRALSDRREALLADFPAALLTPQIENTWRLAAISVYRNWLRYLCEQKSQSKSGGFSAQSPNTTRTGKARNKKDCDAKL